MEAIDYVVKFHQAAKGGFWAEVPALPGCYTQGETAEETIERAKEAIACHLQGYEKRGHPLPVEKQKTKAFSLRVSALLPKSPLSQ